MTDILKSPWNYAVTYLEFFFDDMLLASGSGFFWEHNNQSFLITNWHNFSGRDPETGKPISNSSCAVPNRITYHVYQRNSHQESEDLFVLNVTKHTQPLYHPNSGSAVWYEHPTLGKKVDIAAIAVPNIKNFNCHIDGANSLESDSDIEFYPSQDVFIIGYPLGLVTEKTPVPVWKRGTIATEPYINPDKKPIVYVDTATRKGMSGSVVISRESVVGPYKKKDGSMKEDAFWTRITQVLGIYSGRLSPNNVEAQLGIVWKRHLIDEIVSARKVSELTL